MGKMKEEWIKLQESFREYASEDLQKVAKQREEEWRIEQYNRNRPPELYVRTIEELEKKLKELKQE